MSQLDIIFNMANLTVVFTHDQNEVPSLEIHIVGEGAARVTKAPLSEESIVRLMAYVNAALVSRLDKALRQIEDLKKDEPGPTAELLPFKPKGL